MFPTLCRFPLFCVHFLRVKILVFLFCLLPSLVLPSQFSSPELNDSVGHLIRKETDLLSISTDSTNVFLGRTHERFGFWLREKNLMIMKRSNIELLFCFIRTRYIHIHTHTPTWMQAEISKKQRKNRLNPRKNVSLFTSYAVAHSKIVEREKVRKFFRLFREITTGRSFYSDCALARSQWVNRESRSRIFFIVSF